MTARTIIKRINLIIDLGVVYPKLEPNFTRRVFFPRPAFCGGLP
jgi:hypothetical protein